jgi:hypothetical protein
MEKALYIKEKDIQERESEREKGRECELVWTTEEKKMMMMMKEKKKKSVCACVR